jgi:hypothetical protein
MLASEIKRPLSEEDMFQILSKHPAFTNPIVPMTAATAILNREVHDGKTIMLDKAAGIVLTLPKATGSGCRIRFRVKSLATSNSYIVKVGNTVDIMEGIIACLDSNLATVNQFAFATAADSDTITLDRTNTGSVTIGEWFEVEDTAVGKWQVSGQLSGAAPATPFSASV